MPAPWEQALAKWQAAGLIDAPAAARIREFEMQEKGPAGLRWPSLVAIAFGGMMLAAGVLLFVSAHWDEIAASTRFAMAVSMVAIFHAAGAFAAQKTNALASALHAIGTAALGAGIYLSGQIFNMAEHWPSAILMWAVGAWIGWALRRDGLQLAFVAILTPAWIGAEWVDAHVPSDSVAARILFQGLVLLAITYFSSRRTALLWIGGIALLPLTVTLILGRELTGSASWMDGSRLAIFVAYASPLALAFLLRGKPAWINSVAAVWVFLLSAFSATGGDKPAVYLLCGLGAAGLVAWGMFEHRTERINLGMAGFAITVLAFYFSSVMDKLGRSESLIGLGVLFLAGGWALEKLRRKLVAQMRQTA